MLRTFLDVRWPSIPKPALVFCKDGRHRTGMIAAVLAYRRGASLHEATAEYIDGTFGTARAREVGLILKLCSGA